MDLFAVAEENANIFATRFEELKRISPDVNILIQFAQSVQLEGRISINMRQQVIDEFFSVNRYWNVHEWAADQAQRSSQPAEEILRGRLGSKYDHRVAFDRHFLQGDQFSYGALNIGGAGVACYGEFCVILKAGTFSKHREVAYVKADSLDTFLLQSGPSLIVDEPAVRRDTAPHSHRQCLAAIKHKGEVESNPKTQWADMLCSPLDYIEAIFVKAISIDCVEEVRITKKDQEAIFDAVYDLLMGKTTDESEKFRVEKFAQVQKQLQDCKIPMKEI